MGRVGCQGRPHNCQGFKDPARLEKTEETRKITGERKDKAVRFAFLSCFSVQSGSNTENLRHLRELLVEDALEACRVSTCHGSPPQ